MKPSFTGNHNGMGLARTVKVKKKFSLLYALENLADTQCFWRGLTEEASAVMGAVDPRVGVGGGGRGGEGALPVDFSVTSDEQYRTFLPCCGCCIIRFFNRRNTILSLSIECL